MRMPPLLADFIHNRVCELKCEKFLTRPLQMANIGSMDDIQSLFKETIAEFMENGLNAELDDELGYSRYDLSLIHIYVKR